jgi:hypothetical protein
MVVFMEEIFVALKQIISRLTQGRIEILKITINE